jgi:predicted nuclease of restriction endonuclease-like (RecB) superfamily
MKKESQSVNGEYENILEIIRNKRNNLLRIVNSELIMLFWNIGNSINTVFPYKDQENLQKPVIRKLSNELELRYGRFFSASQLGKMCLFATQYPDPDNLRQFVNYLGWDHILILLSVKEAKARQFYLHQKVTKGLNLKELKKMVALQKSPASISSYAFRAPDFKLLALNDATLPNLFKEPALPSFKALLSGTKKPARNAKKTNSLPEPRFTEIENLINQYIVHQNRFYNSQLGILFWEVGKKINEETSGSRNKDIREYLRKLSTHLLREFGAAFDLKQLRTITDFATVIDDIGLASWITHLVSWKHIILLISLKDRNKIIYYTGLAAKKGLSASFLKTTIAGNTFEQAPENEKFNDALKKTLEYPEKKTTVEKKGNSTVKITIVDYHFEDIEKAKMVNNVFNNLYFLRFITG